MSVKIFTYIKEHSDRVPYKYKLMYNGGSLIDNFINIYQGYKIYINTDSKIIYDYVSNKRCNNIKIYMRDQEDIDQESKKAVSPAINMIRKFIIDYAADEDIVVNSHITSPCLQSATIRDALNMFLRGNCNFLHSVSKHQDCGYLKSYEKPINHDPKKLMRTQDLDPIYISNGAFFIFYAKTFLKYQNRIGPKTKFYPLSKYESIEIDNTDDVELLYKIK